MSRAWLVYLALGLSPAGAAPGEEGRPRVALALSGGGARGFAHIGVLRGLERCGIPVDGIAGTSIGSVVGALYALGYSPAELEEMVLDDDIPRLFREPELPEELPLTRGSRAEWALLKLEIDRGGVRIPAGILQPQRLAERLSLLILKAAGSTGFDRLQVPFAAVATDIENGQKVVLDSGSVVRALRASSAVPGLVGPVEIDRRLLIDGGLASNLPVAEARALGADVVIAVDVSSPLRGRADLSSFLNVVDQTISFAMVEKVARSRSLADRVLAPELGGHSTFDFDADSARNLIVCGEEAVATACADLRRLAGVGSDAVPRVQRSEPHVWAIQVNRLEVTGASPATAREVRRQFGPIPEDSYLSLAELEQRLGRIRASGDVKRVDVDLGVDGPQRTLQLDVAPAAPVLVQVSARYDDKLGSLGRAAVSLRRSGAPLHDLTLDVAFGSAIAARLEARYSRLGGSPFLLFARGVHRRDFDRIGIDREEPGRLTTRRWGLELGSAASFASRTLLAFGWRIERAKSRASLGADPGLEERLIIASLALRGEIDTAQGASFPTRGTQLSLHGEMARSWLGGEARYVLVDAQGKAWLPLGKRTTGYARGRLAGVLDGALPELERRVAGGNEALPGYPRDAFRGDTLGLAGAGIRHRLLRLPGAVGRSLYLSAELGAGTVSGGRKEFSDRGELLYGLALRAAIDSRAGPIELSFGLGRGNRTLLTFSAGPRF